MVFGEGVLCVTDEDGGWVARSPRRDGVLVTWFDLTHQRAYEIQDVVTDEDDEFVFVDTEGRQHRLRPMTLEIYSAEVKDNLVWPPSFDDEESMRHHFLDVAW